MRTKLDSFEFCLLSHWHSTPDGQSKPGGLCLVWVLLNMYVLGDACNVQVGSVGTTFGLPQQQGARQVKFPEIVPAGVHRT